MREYEDEEPYVIIEKHSGSVGSLLFGVAIGAGLALLFAPQSGPETRRGITRQARLARTRASQLADEVSSTVTDTLSQARTQVEERIDAARHAVDMRRQQVARAVDAGRAAAQQARTELQRRIEEGKVAYEAGAAAVRTQAGAGESAIVVPGTADAGVLGAPQAEATARSRSNTPGAARTRSRGGAGGTGGTGGGASEGGTGGATGA